MIFPLAFLLGGLVGWRRAGRRGGDRLDKLQYAIVHGILFALVTFGLIVVAQRLGLV